MATDADEYDPLYLKGIAYFNVCEFFEAHEVWEDLWRSYTGPLRLFYKGLIQAAVALHHFGNDNLHGSRKVYGTSRDYLTQYVPQCEGLDVEKFLADLDACFAEVVNSTEEYPKIDLNPNLIPEIWLNPPVELPTIELEQEEIEG